MFVTVGVGIAAVNTGNNLLYLMLGLMLSLLLLSMVLSEVALFALRVRRRLPRRAFARATCLVEVELQNRKRWMPSHSLEVEDVAVGEPTERRCYFLKVSARGEQVATYRRTPMRRGRLELTGFRVSTRYPFGLVEKAHLYDEPEEMLVLPALVPVPADSAALGIDGAERPSGRIGPGTEIGGLRHYQHGDEARAIHWRRTASLGRVVVREWERDSARRLTLVLDEARPDDAGPEWDEAFEHAVSVAASLTKAALERGSTVDVLTRGGASPVVLPGSPPDSIWRFLALLDPLPASEAPPLSAPRGPAHEVRVEPWRPRTSSREAS